MWRHERKHFDVSPKCDSIRVNTFSLKHSMGVSQSAEASKQLKFRTYVSSLQFLFDIFNNFMTLGNGKGRMVLATDLCA